MTDKNLLVMKTLFTAAGVEHNQGDRISLPEEEADAQIRAGLAMRSFKEETRGLTDIISQPENNIAYIWDQLRNEYVRLSGDNSVIYAMSVTALDEPETSLLNGEDSVIELPVNPLTMIIRCGSALYRKNDDSLAAECVTEGLYNRGDSHVMGHTADGGWLNFNNIKHPNASTTAVGVVSDTYNYNNAWSIEYMPTTRKLSFLQAGDQSSSLFYPVAYDLLITGSW